MDGLDIIGLMSLLGIGMLLFRGSVSIAVGGFLGHALGALVAALLLSLLSAGAASISLSVLDVAGAGTDTFVFLRALLAAVAQPTLTSVAVVGSLLVLSFLTQRSYALSDDMLTLLESHKVLTNKE